MAATAAAPTQKRAWRRWDDVEDRLLAEAVKKLGTKQWENVAIYMRTDRTAKQLQDHWSDRQQQCLELLERMGPAPRPTGPIIRPEAGDSSSKKKKARLAAQLRVQAAKPQNVPLPSLRHSRNPFWKAETRKLVDSVHVERVRGAVMRYLTYTGWLENDIFGGERQRRDDSANAEASETEGPADGSTGKNDGDSLEAQLGLVQEMQLLMQKAENLPADSLITAKDLEQIATPTVKLEEDDKGAGAAETILPGHVRPVIDHTATAWVMEQIQKEGDGGGNWHNLD